MWRIVQPVMFCLIGADLEFTATAVFNTRSVLVCVGLLLVAWLVGVWYFPRKFPNLGSI